MQGITYDIELRLEEDMLGTTPASKDIYTKFIASKAPTPEDAEEEIATVQDLAERGYTTFMRDDDGPFIYNLMIKGFLKEAARATKQFGPLKQLKDKFERFTMVNPRKIRLPEVAGQLERPLRAQTAQGPRVCLVKSDYVKAGTVLKFKLFVMEQSGITEACLAEVLSYGQLQGLGCWRSGSYGTVSVQKLEEVGAEPKLSQKKKK
jgi:hypothetical protein